MEHVTVLDLSFEGSRNQNVCNPGEIDCAKFREMNRNENSSGDSQPYWERIYHTLTTHSKIHTLILGGVQLGDSGVRQLFDALKENTSICLLDLFFNQITSVGLSTIVQVLTSNTSELLQQSSTQEVSAQRSFLPQVSYQLDDQNMSACLSIKNSEDCFNFTSSPRSVSDPVCIVLTNPPIRNLYLSWNEIDDEGMSSVSQLLRCNALLEEIDLSYCMITDLGGTELRDTLRGYTQCVPEIRLQGNTICSDLKSQIQGSARIMRQYGHGNVE